MSVATIRPTCAGCGAELPEARRVLTARGYRTGRPRKWCSEACRKGAYAGACEMCGGPTDGTTPSRGVARVCGDCLRWTDDAIIEAIRADEHGGIPPTTSEWRLASGGSHPSASLVIRRLGWNEMLLRAGFGLHADRRPETQRWIEEQLLAGRPVAEIADTLGVTVSAIYMRFRNRGTTVGAFRARSTAA